MEPAKEQFDQPAAAVHQHDHFGRHVEQIGDPRRISKRLIPDY